MKKTHNVREGKPKTASLRRKAFALALCVSLWLAGGSVAGAAQLWIDPSNNVVYTDGVPPVAPSPAVGGTATDKTLSVTGGDWSGWGIVGGKGSNEDVIGYTLNLTNVSNLVAATGGYNKKSESPKATDYNTVKIANSSVGTVIGGYTSGDERRNAMHNTVILTDVDVESDVWRLVQ